MKSFGFHYLDAWASIRVATEVAFFFVREKNFLYGIKCFGRGKVFRFFRKK